MAFLQRALRPSLRLFWDVMPRQWDILNPEEGNIALRRKVGIRLRTDAATYTRRNES